MLFGFLVSLESIYVPTKLFGTFICISNHQWKRFLSLPSTNKQSFPDYLLDAFYHIYYKSLTPIIVHLSAIAHLNLFQSLPNLHYPRWCSSCTWSLRFCWPNSIQVWLRWLCQIQQSWQWYFKGWWSNWHWNHYSQVCWRQGTISLLTTSGLSSTIIQYFHFQSSSLSSELWRKMHQIKIHLNHWNCIDIHIDISESNVTMVWN